MKILLPVDGSPLSLDAVRHAIALSREGLNVTCVLANVQEQGTLYEVMVAHNADVIDNVRARAGVHLLEGGEALLREAGIEYEIEVGSGEPAHVLIDIAENFGCDAIMLGANDGDTDGDALGPIARAIAESSPLPVTIVRHRDPPVADVSEDPDPQAS